MYIFIQNYYSEYYFHFLFQKNIFKRAVQFFCCCLSGVWYFNYHNIMHLILKKLIFWSIFILINTIFWYVFFILINKISFLMLNLHLAFIHFLVNFIWFFILKLLSIITNTNSVPLIVVFHIFFFVFLVPLSDSATYSLTQITYCFNFSDFFNSMQMYVIYMYSCDRYFAL